MAIESEEDFYDKEEFAPDFEVYDELNDTNHTNASEDHTDLDMEGKSVNKGSSTRNGSQPSTPRRINAIERLSPTLQTESQLKKKHDELAKASDARGERISSSYSNGSRSSVHSSKDLKSKANGKSNEEGEDDESSELEILRAANKDLTNQLVHLSRMLDNQLNLKGIKMSKKSISSEPTPLVESSEAYQSLLKQVQLYKKSNEELKKQLYTASAEKSVEYKNQVKEKRDDIKKLQQEIIALKNIQREQSKQLEIFTNTNEEVQRKYEQELKFANSEARKYKEENLKTQSQLDKLHQQLVYYKEQSNAYQDLLKNKNVTLKTASQIKQIQSELDEEKKKNEDLEKKLAISQKALETWKRKNFIEQKKNKQEKENLEGKIGELETEAKTGTTAAFQKARQMNDKRKNKPALSQPLSPSSKGESKKESRGESKIPKPIAGKKPNVDLEKAKQSRIPKFGEKSPKANAGSKKENSNSDKKGTVNESIDFGDLDLEEDFAEDFEVTDESKDTANEENEQIEENVVSEEKLDTDTAGEEIYDETSDSQKDIFKPSF